MESSPDVRGAPNPTQLASSCPPTRMPQRSRAISNLYRKPIRSIQLSGPALPSVFQTHGKNHPSDSALTKCLKDMLTHHDQRPIYLVMDALDESPISSGILSARERLLQLLKELVDLSLPKLHMSRADPKLIYEMTLNL